MTNKLWERHTTFFVIEIKVGATWVEQARAKSENEAMILADKIVHDPSVRAVRIIAHQIVHTATSIHEKEQSVVMRLPPKMKKTGQTANCPRCTKPSDVVSDGALTWVFCTRCNTAMPN